MVLVSIVASVREDDVRRGHPLQLLEEFLDLGHLRREEPVALLPNDDAAGSGAVQETPRGLARLGLPLRVAAEDDPDNAKSGVSRGQLENGAAASDLDVIGVCAEAQDFANPFARLAQP